MTKKQSLIERVASGGAKSYTSGNLASAYLTFGAGGATGRSQLEYTKYGVASAYMRVPALKTSVDMIADSLNSIPMQIVNTDGDVLADSRDYGNDSITLERISDAYADQHMPLMWLWAADVLLYGEAFIAKLLNDYDYITGLERLNPLGTYAQELRGRIGYFQYMGTDKSETLPPDRVIYTRGFNPVDDIAGHSKALTALAKANVELEFDKFTLAFYANSGHPGLIFSPKNKDLSREDVEYLATLWREQFRGADKFFKSHISQYPFDVEALPQVDITQPMAVSERAELSIYRAFGIDPSILGMRGGNAISNSGAAVSEALRSFMLLVVRPLARKIENAVNHANLVGLWDGDGLRLRFDFSDYEKSIEIDIQRQQYYERLYLSGAISLATYQRGVEEDVMPDADDIVALPQGVSLFKNGQPYMVNTQPPMMSVQVPRIEQDNNIPTKAAPKFKRYTYNGITCQATARRSSSRDDKAWERTVRYKDNERVVHYADPDMPMRRNNDEARANFLSRHNCDGKRDPFAPGFWSCYDWANVDEGAKSLDAQYDEIRKWYRKASQKGAAAWFNPDVLPNDVVYYIRNNLHDGIDRDALKSVFDSAKAMLTDSVNDVTIETALTRLSELGYDDLVEDGESNV